AWIDRRGGRLLMSFGSVVAAMLLALWSQTQSLLMFYAIWAGLGFAMAATLYEPVFVVLTRRFPRSFRMRITVLTLIAGLASTVFMPLTQILVDSLGWRDTLLVLAVVNLAICLPVHALWLRDGGEHERTISAAPPVDRRAVMRRAMRSPVFWGLALCLTAYGATFSAFIFHLIPMLAERGVPTAVALAAVALIGPAQVAGRLVIFVFSRRLPTALTGRIVLLALPASIALLIRFPDSAGVLFTATVFYGCANGIITILRSAAVPDLMWRDGYGAINGALAFPAMAAQGLAPVAAALIWTAAGGYNAVLWTLLAVSTVAAIAFWVAAAMSQRVPPPAEPNLPARR
ncbi:MAG TPA: MFS transporter, partial [Dongiaceae bacterium]